MDISVNPDPNRNNPVNKAHTIGQIKDIYETYSVKNEPGQHSYISSVETILKPESGKRKNKFHVETREQEIKASYLMSTPVVTLHENTSKSEAREMIKKYHFHHFPVTDKNGKLKGLLTDRDILRDEPHVNHQKDDAKINEYGELVSSIMSTNVIVASENSCMCDIGKIMLSEKVKCIPVVDANNLVKGMITSSDFIRGIVNYHAVNDLV